MGITSFTPDRPASSTTPSQSPPSSPLSSLQTAIQRHRKNKSGLLILAGVVVVLVYLGTLTIHPSKLHHKRIASAEVPLDPNAAINNQNGRLGFKQDIQMKKRKQHMLDVAKEHKAKLEEAANKETSDTSIYNHDAYQH